MFQRAGDRFRVVFFFSVSWTSSFILFFSFFFFIFIICINHLRGLLELNLIKFIAKIRLSESILGSFKLSVGEGLVLIMSANVYFLHRSIRSICQFVNFAQMTRGGIVRIVLSRLLHDGWNNLLSENRRRSDSLIR